VELPQARETDDFRTGGAGKGTTPAGDAKSIAGGDGREGCPIDKAIVGVDPRDGL